MALNRVVITGYGALTPLGNNANDFWQGLINGVSGANEITRFDASKFKTQFACELKNFDPSDYYDKKELRKLDPFTLYALIASDEAFKHAKFQTDRLRKDRCGVIWGSGIGGLETLTTEINDFVTGDGTPRFSPYLITKMIIDIVAGQIAIKYGFEGVNYATVAACASSAVAIIDAYYNIQLGKADVIIAGGSEAPINPVGVGGFNSITALSTRNEDYKTASRPFDKDRDGFVIGEGAGALIIENYDHAVKRKATIYAEIVGTGISCDASHITAPQPEGKGAYKAMQIAINDANIKPEDIDYINAHGTSTPLGDIAELYAIRKLFNDSSRLAISSTKSMTGHLLGAAGAVEAIASIMSIQHGIMPPTINHFTDDPDIENLKLNIIYNKTKKRKTNYAMSNAFGFGGHNTSIIFKKV
ncbi:MAG: beta-ketoacyl-ACP synthase II [Bacteroidales bacterium]|jgi:3-oxoacyl-[acyl-carrier-protein] synthase II|nr:beta-ketoacyl-ACP synthase II [Bacteroidales bacterium]